VYPIGWDTPKAGIDHLSTYKEAAKRALVCQKRAKMHMTACSDTGGGERWHHTVCWERLGAAVPGNARRDRLRRGCTCHASTQCIGAHRAHITQNQGCNWFYLACRIGDLVPIRNAQARIVHTSLNT
jgi:hypothetical protein